MLCFKREELQVSADTSQAGELATCQDCELPVHIISAMVLPSGLIPTSAIDIHRLWFLSITDLIKK